MMSNALFYVREVGKYKSTDFLSQIVNYVTYFENFLQIILQQQIYI